jgi:P-type Cu+ transporter
MVGAVAPHVGLLWRGFGRARRGGTSRQTRRTAEGQRPSAAAIAAANVALMRDDWAMVPEAVRIRRSAAATIRRNLGLTALDNAVGIGLAAAGLLPPVWPAAAQSLPDVAIMLTSARLLRGSASEARR